MTDIEKYPRVVRVDGEEYRVDVIKLGTYHKGTGEGYNWCDRCTNRDDYLSSQFFASGETIYVELKDS